MIKGDRENNIPPLAISPTSEILPNPSSDLLGKKKILFPPGIVESKLLSRSSSVEAIGKNSQLGFYDGETRFERVGDIVFAFLFLSSTLMGIVYGIAILIRFFRPGTIDDCLFRKWQNIFWIVSVALGVAMGLLTLAEVSVVVT